MSEHIFTGFGFGPIQSGLFVAEAYKSGNFARIVIAEIDQNLVDAVRTNKGSYYVNVATSHSVEVRKIDGIEIYNPNVQQDRKQLLDALSRSTEIVTSLPSVKFFDVGQVSVASLISQALKNSKAPAAIIYAAENNNHAAEILREKVGYEPAIPVQYLNTVIGKMSQVVTDADEIRGKNLKPVAPGIDRAFLVEQFNKILVTRCNLAGFRPGIEVFIEKEDLLPFEETKLYGHNAIHALLAYLGAYKGYKKMADIKDDAQLMRIARDAFINESGAALIRKHKDIDDELFTQAGYRDFAEDLLERMTNPYLDDTIARAARDPQRKLGLNDRIFGTIQLALEYGIAPVNMTLAAAAGVSYLMKNEKFESDNVADILLDVWSVQKDDNIQKLIELVTEAFSRLKF
jgi:mannitol-1-phosphate 5-dehydrogenase